MALLIKKLFLFICLVVINTPWQVEASVHSPFLSQAESIGSDEIQAELILKIQQNFATTKSNQNIIISVPSKTEKLDILALEDIEEDESKPISFKTYLNNDLNSLYYTNHHCISLSPRYAIKSKFLLSNSPCRYILHCAYLI